MWEHLSRSALDIAILKYSLSSITCLENFPRCVVNDQCRLNFALKNMGFEWSKLLDDKTMTGEDRNGLEIVVLPQMHICRHICITNSTLDFYYSQAFGGTIAQKGAQFLRQDWAPLHVKSTLTGTEWLKSVSACHGVMLSNT